MEINIKNEILNVIKYYNLEIIEIDCYFKNNKHIEKLDDLDITINNESDKQGLYGIIWCIDLDTKIPVWLERIKITSIEQWQYNSIPVSTFEKMLHKITNNVISENN